VPDEKPPAQPPPAQGSPAPGPAKPAGPEPGDKPGKKSGDDADGKSGDKSGDNAGDDAAEEKPGEEAEAAAAEPGESERDSAIRDLQGKANRMSQAQMDKFVARGINQLNAETINIFGGDYADDLAEDLAGRRRGTGRILFTSDDLDNATVSFVDPPGFSDELNLLADRNLIVLAGPARTGKRTRALEILRRTLREVGRDEVVEELPSSVLTNLAWRVPGEGAGFVVFDDPGREGAFTAARIGEEWLHKTAQRLLEAGSYLVVVTGPVSGSLDDAPNRAEYVLDEWALPDPREILHHRLRDVVPSEAEDLIERLAETELAEVLIERDSPGFAARAATVIIEGHRGGRDLADIVTKLADPKELVREWLSREPDAKDLSLVLATAVLDKAGYLKVADAAVALYQRLTRVSKAPLTLRYARQLTADHAWIKRGRAEDADTPSLGFRQVQVRPAVLGTVWREYDGARRPMLAWLKDLAMHSDPEVRAGAAQALGILSCQDLEHGLHEYLQPWGRDGSDLLQQTVARGLNIVGTFGSEQAAWSVLEKWAEAAHSENTENLCTTAALAAGGSLGVREPGRGLGVLRDLVVCDGKWGILWAVAVSARALVNAGRGDHVLEAILEWTEPGNSSDTLAKALLVFTEVVRPETDENWPRLLRTADANRKQMSLLFSRAMVNRIARHSANNALCTWVRRVDNDPGAEPVVGGLVGDIAEESPADGLRVLHALSQWAQDRYQPSLAAATFHDLMYEAEDEVP
jgi:hypothetical protein